MMLKARSSASQHGQWTLISLLVTMAIIVILAAIYFPKIAAEHSAPGAAPTPKERAYGVGCIEYQGQMNQAVSMYKSDHDDQPPATLEDLKKYGVTDEMIYAKGCSFAMDPTTGRVTDTGKGRARRQRRPSESSYSPRDLPTGFHPDQPVPAPGSNQAPPQGDNTQPAPAGDNSQPAAPPSHPNYTVGPGGVHLPNIPTSGNDPGDSGM